VKLLRHILLSVVLMPALAIASPIVNADFFPGQWDAQFYPLAPEGFPRFAAGVCLQADGTWYMTTTFASGGRWYLTGVNLLIHGGSNHGSNGAGQLLQVTPKLLTGHWQAWTDDRQTDGYLTTKWRFVSKHCDPPAPEDPDTH